MPKRTNFQPSAVRLQAAFHQRLDFGGVAAIVRVADDLVAHLAAQQLVDRHAQRLALDVVERDVDGGHRRREDALRGEEAAPEEHLPDVLDAERVLPDEDVLEVLDRADHGQLAPGDARLADAVDAFVGIDDDEQEVAVSGPHGITFDVGDLHCDASS